MTCRKPQRFSFLVKEGYLQAALALLALELEDADSGKYLGRTSMASTSCCMMTKDLPCGSQVIMAEMLGSERMRISLWGKISLMQVGVVVFFSASLGVAIGRAQLGAIGMAFTFS